LGALWTQYVIDPMTWGLDQFTHYLWGSYALAIIAFTIFIKVLLLPLTMKQLQSQRAQQALQPQLQELKRKYGNDKVKLNEETMRLYKENNANPVAGCLPTLIQFPILIGLYNALYALLRQPGVHAGFLWVRNLALPDFWSVTDPVTHHMIFNGLFILPLLAGGLQWIQQRMMMNPAANQDPQQKMMNQMMQFMPLMVVFFGFRFPAGLAVYWCTSTLVAIVQQYFINGWGSLATLVPVLRYIPPPGRSGIVPPPPSVTAPSVDDSPRAVKTAARGRPQLSSSNGRDAKRDGPTNGAAAPSGLEDGGTAARGGAVRAAPRAGEQGVRRNGPDAGRTRPATRKQGSKR